MRNGSPRDSFADALKADLSSAYCLLRRDRPATSQRKKPDAIVPIPEARSHRMKDGAAFANRSPSFVIMLTGFVGALETAK